MTFLWVYAAGFGLVALAIWISTIRGKTCKGCFYPAHRCTCDPECGHAEKFPAIWSQDGWIAKCKVCGQIQYLGDGPDPLDLTEVKTFLRDLDNGRDVEG